MVQVQLYADYLDTEKKVSLNTKKSYLRDIMKFCTYLKKRSIEDLTKVDHHVVESYLLMLQKNGMAVSSVYRAQVALRSFYAYLCSRGRMEQNPVDALKLPKREKTKVEVLTPREVEQLIGATAGSSFKCRRDNAMLEVLYATGIRVSELLGLNRQQIHMKERYIQVESRGRERVVPLGDIAAAALQRYLDLAADRFGEVPGQIFVNQNGGPLSRQGFWKIVKQYKEKAGIKKEITPHTFRHSFAVHLIAGGADVGSVQEMMGHKEKATTMEYVDIASRRLGEIYRRAHPRA